LRWRVAQLSTHFLGFLSEVFGYFMQAGRVQVVDRSVEMTQSVRHFLRLRRRGLTSDWRTEVPAIALDSRRPFPARPKSPQTIPINASAGSDPIQLLFESRDFFVDLSGLVSPAVGAQLFEFVLQYVQFPIQFLQALFAICFTKPGIKPLRLVPELFDLAHQLIRFFFPTG